MPVILTPHTRGLILRAIVAAGTWKGTRNGIKIKFKLTQPTLDGNRIQFQAIQSSTKQIAGIVGTVSEAAQKIEEFF